MNPTLPPSPGTWLNLVGSREAVLGPSKGHAPNLGAFRIAYLHLSPHVLLMFGCVTDMPLDSESNGERGAVRKFNLLLEVSVRQIQSISGQPQLDPENDDSMHGFQLARPVSVKIIETNEPVYADGTFNILRISGEASHLSFEVLAESIHAHGGKHAKKRFEGGSASRNAA